MSDEYVLGTHDDEARRLGLQHRLWSAAALDAWSRAGLGVGSRVLDVGCGPGFATFDLAQLGADIVAIDESPAFVAAAEAGVAARGFPQVRVISGDVQNLPGACAVADVAPGFDFAWARWVLCFVPNPEAVVQGVAEMLASGGRFVVHDYFNYEAMTLAPRAPAFTRVVAAIGASFRTRGGDPDVFARLPRLCERHGLRVAHFGVHQRVARPGDPMWAWGDSFFRGFVPRLVDTGFLTATEGADWLEEWDARCADPDGFIFYPPVHELIAEKD